MTCPTLVIGLAVVLAVGLLTVPPATGAQPAGKVTSRITAPFS
jgi:hypothetical protein